VLVLLLLLLITVEAVSARLNTVTNALTNRLWFGQAEIDVVEDFAGWDGKDAFVKQKIPQVIENKNPPSRQQKKHKSQLR